MAFPQVAGTAISTTGTNQTNHTVSLPDGITTGNLLIVGFASDGTPTITWPAGWTQIFSEISGSAVTLECRYRVVDGTEGFTGTGDTISITTSVAESTQHCSYRISSQHASSAPEAGVATVGTSTAPDPPSLSPSWGAEDTLWLVFSGSDGDSSNVLGFPANYVSGIADVVTTASVNIGSARRELNATSENPSSFTIETSEQWVANVIAVRPVPPAEVFPEVVTIGDYSHADATSHPIPVPSGTTSGDMLLAFVRSDGTPTLGWPSGWNHLDETTHSSNAIKTAVRYRIADGTEGSTITVTTSVSENFEGIIVRITGYDPETAPAISSAVQGASTEPDSPSLVAPWGSAKNLWLSFAANDAGTGAAFSAGPASYTTHIEDELGFAAVAYRQLETDTENPAAFTTGASQEWNAYTVVIRPETESISGWGMALGAFRNRLVR